MTEQVAAPADLPATIRIFPLEGVVLPPRGVLPLNIFEPRYLALVKDAMATDRLIGMIQPRGDREVERPALYQVGGLGRITQFSDTGDGRFLIALTGVIRFRIVDELPVTTPYRQVRVDYSEFTEDWGAPPALSAAERQALEAGMQSYLEAQGLSADWDAVRAADDESLVNTLALVCPFASGERQALLEAASLAHRADTLTTLMALAVPGGAPPVLQ
jgi:Lon protease-like protein